MRLDSDGDLGAPRVFGPLEVLVRLEIHPKLGRGPEIASQAEKRAMAPQRR
jgi:hypothetical protein